jgi:hypothetical protein
MKYSSAPAVFDRAGRFVRIIGRTGQGPGEIRYASNVVRSFGDSIWIIDGSRKHVYAPDLRYVRQDPIRIGDFNHAVGRGNVVVASGQIAARGSAGYPLHLLDSAFEITRSFGTDDPTVDQRRLQATNDDPGIFLPRNFAQPGWDDFWAYNDYRFLLEKYNFSGQILQKFRHSLDGWYAEGTRRKPSPGEFKGLALNTVQTSADPNVLWLVYHDPRPEYREPAEGSRVDLAQWIAMHDLVIEAFDVMRGRVIATGRFPKMEAFKVANAPDKLAIVHPIQDAFYTYRIVNVQVTTTNK